MREKTEVKAKKKHIVLKVFAVIMAILVINTCLNRFCWRSFGFLYCDYIGTMPDRASQVYDESKGMYCTRVLVSYGHRGLLFGYFDGFVYKIEGSTLKVGVNRQFTPFLRTTSYSAGLEIYTDTEITEVYLCDAFHKRPVEMIEYYDEFFPYFAHIVKE